MSRRRRFTVAELAKRAPSLGRRRDAFRVAAPRKRERSGFTILELLVVFAVASVLIALTGKSISSAFSGNSRSSAVRVASATLFQARSLAIQRSAKATLVHAGNTLIVYGDSLGTRVQVGRTVDLNQRYGVTISGSSRDSVMFDSRGLITGTTVPYRIIITKGSNADTVCATGLANTRQRGC